MSDKLQYRHPNGRLIKGHPGLPGAGRPTKKREILDGLIERFYGPDCQQILLDMIEIAQYDAATDRKNNWMGPMYKFFKPKFTNQQVFDARKFLFEHYYGRPVQETKSEISTIESAKIKINFVGNDG